MKSKEEVEDLKADWANDPCWDLEDTEGFEDHRAELRQYALERQMDWRKQLERRCGVRYNKTQAVAFAAKDPLRSIAFSLVAITAQLQKMAGENENGCLD